MYWVNENFANRMVNLTNNLGTLGMEMYGNKTFLVNYRNVEFKRLTSEEMFSEIANMRQEIEPLQGLPREYLEAKLTSSEYFLRYILGEEIEYAILLDKIQQLPCEEIQREEIEAIKLKAMAFLNELNFTGDLKTMKENWYSENYLESDDVIAFANKYIEAFKVLTEKNIVKLNPEDEIDNVKGIRGVFWSGYSEYTGGYKGNLTFNIDKKWNKYEFIHVLAHEAYPGHQASYSRWDELLAKDEFPMEAAYYLLNEPINTLFEGGPENAIAFLNNDFEAFNDLMGTEEVHSLLGVRHLMKLTRMAQTNASFYYNTGKMSEQECILYMMNEGLMNELDAKNTFRFFSDKLSVSTYPTYYYGRKYVEEAFESIPQEKISAFFDIMYNQPHTNRTFKKAVENLISEKSE